MGHGHECKPPPYTIPHYSVYKVEGVPKLEYLQNVLAQKGLKDPWIRNEVWRYHPGFGSIGQRARTFFFRGFLWGLGLTVITVGAEKMLGSGGHGHGHDEHGHH